MKQPILNGILESDLDLAGYGFVNIEGLLGTFQGYSPVLDTLAATSPSYAGLQILQFAAPGVDSLLGVHSNGVPYYAAGSGYVPSSRIIHTQSPLDGGGALTGDLTLSISAAGQFNDGYLSAADWNVFNGKVAATRSIATTAPLSGGGDFSANRTISITQATTSSNGYLSSTDWNTFNGKQAALGFTPVPNTRTVNGHALSSDVTVTPTDLGLVIGTNVQAYSANLTTLAGQESTPLGLSLLGLGNPPASSYIKISSAGVVSYQSATGVGTVTSFSAGDLSPLFTTSEATVTTTPALTFSLSVQAANKVFAGPTTGADAAPTFRALVAADIPALDYEAFLGFPASDGSILSSGIGGVRTWRATGTGVITALAVNVGSAGAFIVNGGALGTPSSGTLTNATGLPIGGINFLSTDGTFASPSDSEVPSTQAVKTYVDANAGGTGGVIGTARISASFNEESVTSLDRADGVLTGATLANDSSGNVTVTFATAEPDANYVVTMPMMVGGNGYGTTPVLASPATAGFVLNSAGSSNATPVTFDIAILRLSE